MPKRRSAAKLSTDNADYDMISDDSYDERPQKKAKPPATRPRKVAKLAQSKLTMSGSLTITQEDDFEIHKIPSHGISSHIISSKSAEEISSALVVWFDSVYTARGMPWRKRFDTAWTVEERGQRAYEVWVSEIMLQQTQVATVIPYYNRWMAKFPTIKDLAEASIDSVHALWKGLGYYSRASRLLEGAKKVTSIASFNGRLPNNAKAMQSDVPGVGRYSAGAICSIAYDERVPVLDGNVNRLLSRILALHASPKAKQTLDTLWAAATSLVESPGADRPGDLNQALIELGSTICKPRDPACDTCPVHSSCGAYALQTRSLGRSKAAGAVKPEAANIPPELSDIEELCSLCDPNVEAPLSVTSFPMKAEKKKAREEMDLVHILEWRAGSDSGCERYFLMVKRPEGGLLAGLQEFPTLANIETLSSTHSDMAAQALSITQDYIDAAIQPFVQRGIAIEAQGDDGAMEDALRITRIKTAGEVLHIFSHIRKTYVLRWIVLEGGTAPPVLRRPPYLRTVSKAKQAVAKGASTSKVAQSRQSKLPVELDDEEVDIIGSSPTVTRWVSIENVRDANIGTGVVKMWDQVRRLWEKA